MSLPNSQDKSKHKLRQISGLEDPTLGVALTGRGRGAVAVVGLRGPRASSCLLQNFRPATESELRSGQVRYGQWVGGANQSLAAESVVVSPTSEQSFEVHCHGGPAAIARILNDLEACGVRICESSSEYFEQSPLIAEATEVLKRCSTARTAAIALEQLRGAMLHWAKVAIQRLNDHSVSATEIQKEAGGFICKTLIGRVLSEPYRVVLCGPPNVGKSSLLNRIVGYDRSITFDHAGTTRDVLRATTVIDGWPVELIDTAGIRDQVGAIEQQGIEQAMHAAENADLVLLVEEIDPEKQVDDEQILFLRSLQFSDRNLCRVLNKIDQSTKTRSDAFDSYDFCVSAVTGQGIDALLSGLVAPLNQIQHDAGSPVPITRRQSRILKQIEGAENHADALNLLNQMMTGTMV